MRVLPTSCLGSRGPAWQGARQGRVLSERKAPCPHGKQVCRRASQKRQATSRQVPGQRSQCVPAHPRVPEPGVRVVGSPPPARQRRHGTHTPLSVCKLPSGRRRVRGDRCLSHPLHAHLWPSASSLKRAVTLYCLLPARGPVGGPAPGLFPFQSVTPAPPLPSVVPQRVLRLPKSCLHHRNCGDPAPCHSWACLGRGGRQPPWLLARTQASRVPGPLSALCRGWRLPPPFSSRKPPHPALQEACSTCAGRLPLSWGQLQGHAAPRPCPRPAWRRRTQPLCREQLHQPLPQQRHIWGVSHLVAGDDYPSD